ncbi:MAG: DUF1579 domain-containing protein [Caldimonas sp.]
MTHLATTRRFALAAWLAFAVPLAAAQRPDTATLLAAQADAMKALAMIDGIWRGTATATQPDGSQLVFTQTERMGSFLGGTIKVIEGRGYAAGQVRFNALGIVSYDVAKKAYTIHSHAQGLVGDFAFEPTTDGYRWQIPLGPAASMRYVAVVKDGELFEVGDRLAAGREPVRVFQMRLKRVADTDWPAGNAVLPK